MNAFLRYLILIIVAIALICGFSLAAAYLGYDPGPFVRVFAIYCIFEICKLLNKLLKKKPGETEKDEE